MTKHLPNPGVHAELLLPLFPSALRSIDLFLSSCIISISRLVWNLCLGCAARELGKWVSRENVCHWASTHHFPGGDTWRNASQPRGAWFPLEMSPVLQALMRLTCRD